MFPKFLHYYSDNILLNFVQSWLVYIHVELLRRCFSLLYIFFASPFYNFTEVACHSNIFESESLLFFCPFLKDSFSLSQNYLFFLVPLFSGLSLSSFIYLNLFLYVFLNVLSHYFLSLFCVFVLHILSIVSL